MRDTHPERERGRDTGRGRSRLHAGTYVGLDPRSPGSHPRLQVVLNRYATWLPGSVIFKERHYFFLSDLY